MGENVAPESAKTLALRDLPNEDIVKIFSYLSLCDRKNARLVCVRWRNLSYELKLISNDLTEVENYIDLSLFGRHTRHVNIRVCKEPDPDADYRLVEDFWGRHGGDVKSLEFVCGPSTFKFLRTILPKCGKLQYLTLLMVPIDNGDLINFSAGTPALRRFQRKGDTSVVFRLLDLVAGNTSRLAGPGELLERIFQIDPNLNTFEIEIINVPDVILNLLAQGVRENIDIKQLLKFGPEDCCPGNLSKLTPNMKDLFVADCECRAKCLLDAISNMRRLSFVSFLRVADLTNSVLSALASLRNLTHLELGWWDSEDEGEGLKIALGTTEKPLIAELRLIACNITDDVIETIAPKLPNLKILNLTCCRSLSIGSLRAIFGYNTRLECLSIAGCGKMDCLYFDADLSIGNLQNLLHLDVSNISFSAESFKRFKVPSLLALEYRPRPVGPTMKEIRGAFPSLTYVNNARLGLRAGKRKGMQNASFLACMKSPFKKCVDAYTRYSPGFD